MSLDHATVIFNDDLDGLEDSTIPYRECDLLSPNDDDDDDDE